LLAWVKNHLHDWLRADLPSGLTLAVAVIPKVMAYATIDILAGAQLGRVAPGGNTATLLPASVALAMLVGVLMVLASDLRIGLVANYIAVRVLPGVKAGIGIVITLNPVSSRDGESIDDLRKV
jgi:MFS superfamily sulfate permease-like transporter